MRLSSRTASALIFVGSHNIAVRAITAWSEFGAILRCRGELMWSLGAKLRPGCSLTTGVCELFELVDIQWARW